jgi:ABC-type antimicrobial peptide transport system permease subunit
LHAITELALPWQVCLHKTYAMLPNQLTVLFRTIWRTKTYSFLNIFGLAIGITCASFIFLWVENELTFNHNFQKRNSLFSIMEIQESAGKPSTIPGGPMPLAEDLKNKVPGVKNTARLSWDHKQFFVLDEKVFSEVGRYADSSLLSMLNFTFVYGSAPSLQSPESIIISESMSVALFGQVNPVGKIVRSKTGSPWTKDGNFTITGVFKDFPVNSSYRVNWFSPFKLFEDLMHPEWNKWAIPVETLVEMEPTADIAATDKRLQHYMKAKVDGSTMQLFLFSMNDWNLYSHFTNGKPDGGKIRYVHLFSLIAIIILVIACINFMNLSTARSEKRAKEVGIRKVSGAFRYQLVSQFIKESLTLSFLAVVLAMAIISICLPLFNKLVDKELSAGLFRVGHLLFFLSIGLVCGLLSGIYPAFYLSSFRPVVVLKGLKMKPGGGSVSIRKGLVIAQFVISVMLIIATVVVYQQIQFVKSRDLGYKTNNMVEFVIPSSLVSHFRAIREEMLRSGSIENAAMAYHPPLDMSSSSEEYEWAGKSPNTPVTVYDIGVSAEYISTMHMKLVSGRDFYDKPGKDSTLSAIINETMAKLMGAEGRIGGNISRKGFPSIPITGIVQDFIFNDMYGAGGPILMVCIPQAADHMMIALNPQMNIKESMAKIDHILTTAVPGYPFDYKFVDEDLNKLFETENMISKLATVFAVLAILISCLGLFGLATYTAEKRTKEIGIRKVLGASVRSLTRLLSLEYLKLVCISCIIAFPLAWWALHAWLQDYQYRTTIHWWVFAVAGISALAIAMMTVSFQAIKVAIGNPVKSLRTE